MPFDTILTGETFRQSHKTETITVAKAFYISRPGRFSVLVCYFVTSRNGDEPTFHLPWWLPKSFLFSFSTKFFFLLTALYKQSKLSRLRFSIYVLVSSVYFLLSFYLQLRKISPFKIRRMGYFLQFFVVLQVIYSFPRGQTKKINWKKWYLFWFSKRSILTPHGKAYLSFSIFGDEGTRFNN